MTIPLSSNPELFKQRNAHRMAHAQRYGDQRAALFGNPNVGRGGQAGGRAGSSGGANGKAAKAAANSHAMMEAENDQMIEDLEAKVQVLKEVGFGIKNEAADSNDILSNMGGWHMWYMVAFVVFVFLLMWWFYGAASRGGSSVSASGVEAGEILGTEGGSTR
uniref:t-SNARE coiled-coil homology domain-containing protein n=1 Tax=Chromera velia CCMP2878 TaxID=1169474 RepID=A0A0G4F6G4_9ALVE|eukprot:Cvel_15317.t1-p1 / transcript=Cvel_15317.t1 / gene=Cvel_15317 / organism=Chromera_velia_CCMP2878 / gene_product=hypothetical protein / transcript_product=hypothetical protein / location=Cvel_scaffold1126:25777-29546(+) / protein_length=161 / sequence_SO=supercontig / SO=protein_coding / is_pseudo=false